MKFTWNKVLYLAATICFVLAAFDAGSLPWIPIGLALIAAAPLVS